jgi:hypothetical protein
MVILEKQVTGRWHGTKRVILRRERVEIEPNFRPAYAGRLGSKTEVVDVIFR